MKSPSTLIRATLAATGLVFATLPARALVINLFDQGGVTVGSNAYTGFTKAAHFWEQVITSNTTVNLNVKFSALGAGILGSTGSTTQVAYIEPTLAALQASGNSALDAVKVLPTLQSTVYGPGYGAIDALISAPKANGTGVLTSPLTRVLDNNDSGNNIAFSANTSLLKAIGITPTYSGANLANQIDGSISFSNAYNFDFDPTNGIAANAIDFIGVAIHEIGHALGFRSGVDIYDANTNFSGDLNNYAIMSIWDIFRYSSQSAALGVNDWAIGDTPYFSIDGGASVYQGGYLSTGANFGDGRQASHWKDINPPLGLLDPTVAYGQQTFVTSLDLAAYDAMGWNVAFDVMANPNRSYSTAQIGADNFSVPDAGATAGLLGLALAAMAGLRRRFGC